jgi:hypothetical protein
MGIIEKLFGKKKQSESVDQKPAIEKETEFVFSTSESTHIGDLYEYRVKANSKKEAFDKLVQYLFGEGHVEDVKSDHKQFSYPGHATFNVEGMPMWFGKRISGHLREGNANYQHNLEEYCFKNGIKLNPRK